MAPLGGLDRDLLVVWTTPVRVAIRAGGWGHVLLGVRLDHVTDERQQVGQRVAEEDERQDRHDGDESQDECVLSQALAPFLANRSQPLPST